MLSSDLTEDISEAHLVSSCEYCKGLGAFELIKVSNSADIQTLTTDSLNASKIITTNITTDKINTNDALAMSLSTGILTTDTLSTQTLSTHNLVTSILVTENLSLSTLTATSLMTDTLTVAGGTQVVRVDHGKEPLYANDLDRCYQANILGLKIVEGATGHFIVTVCNSAGGFVNETLCCSVIYFPGETFFVVNVREVDDGFWNSKSFYLDWTFTQIL
jgi:hypothetical protein